MTRDIRFFSKTLTYYHKHILSYAQAILSIEYYEQNIHYQATRFTGGRMPGFVHITHSSVSRLICMKVLLLRNKQYCIMDIPTVEIYHNICYSHACVIIVLWFVGMTANLKAYLLNSYACSTCNLQMKRNPCLSQI